MIKTGLLTSGFFAVVDELPEAAGFAQLVVFAIGTDATAEEEVLERVGMQHTLHYHDVIAILILFHSEVDAVVIII
jgi:hypothetical protein